jgi:hypothetical protein
VAHVADFINYGTSHVVFVFVLLSGTNSIVARPRISSKIKAYL